jgi:hypothetical protein
MLEFSLNPYHLRESRDDTQKQYRLRRSNLCLNLALLLML